MVDLLLPVIAVLSLGGGRALRAYFQFCGAQTRQILRGSDRPAISLNYRLESKSFAD